jgi:3-oxoacyl-[acyl-carrier-protein] synthase-3
MSRPRAKIIGTGSYLPERCLTNDELSRQVNTSDEWIRTRTGIRERHIAAPDEYTSDLAVQAARRALDAAALRPTELDLILLATSTPDLVFPSTATIVQQKLGAAQAQMPAFDIQAVCTGFVYAVSVAEKYIAAGACRNVLVIGAETFSRIVDWTDRSTCILFGDGAGAVVLQAGSNPEVGLLSTHIHADGSYVDLLRTSGGVSNPTGRSSADDAEPWDADEDPIDDITPRSGLDLRLRGAGYVQMRGNEVFRKAVTVLGQIADDTLAANGLRKSDLNWLVPHQANLRIIKSMAKRLDMKMDQVVVTVDRHGNTSAASVPLALDEAVRDGRIQSGQLVMMEAFGGGFTWGSVLARWV